MTPTQEYKQQIREQVDRPCYRRIVRLSNDILKKLPARVPLGEVAAALMLAATAFSESAQAAQRLSQIPGDDDQ